MPAKNTVKSFMPESMYHVYNRGVDKRTIFLDQQDYAVFMSFLKGALAPKSKQESYAETTLLSEAQRFNLRRLNLFGEVELMAFCLMPNHFHLLLYQRSSDGITKLMRSIATGYSSYFNKRYTRTGTLFEGRYKGKRIDFEIYWQHISRYIHLNPVDLGRDYKDYPYSSYRFYVGTARAEWLMTELLLKQFVNRTDYEKFHDGYLPYRKELAEVKHLLANY